MPAFGHIAEAGGACPVVMVSADDRLPYYRPHVSKGYLAGTVDADSLALSPPDWYAANDVEVLLDCEVTGLDIAARLATTTGTDPLHWDRCVLATGASPTPLPVPGADDPAVSSLRSANDAEALIARLAGPVIVVGSGFVGCEAAMSLRQRGCDVTMVSEEARPQQDRLGEPVGRLISGWLHDGGVRLLGGRQVGRIERHGDAVVVIVPDAPPLEAAHVVAAVGATPNLQLAEALGLSDGHTLAVDAHMRTAAPGVFAIGDIATAWHASAERHLRVEHWGDAEAQGRVVGRHLAGEPAAWTTPPGFWSTIGSETIKHVAWGDGHDEVVVRASPEGETFWYGRDGVVVGVLTHGHDDDAESAGAAVAGRHPMPSSTA